MKYLHYFETTSAFNAAYSDWGGQHKEPWVGVDLQAGTLSYNDPNYIEIPEGYTFVAKGVVTIDSSDYNSEVSGFVYGYPVAPSNDYYKLYINGTVYSLSKYIYMHEFDHYYIAGGALADGTYPNAVLLHS